MQIATTRYDYILGDFLLTFQWTQKGHILFERVSVADFKSQKKKVQCIQYSIEKWGATLDTKCAHWVLRVKSSIQTHPIKLNIESKTQHGYTSGIFEHDKTAKRNK